jgi:hypothetical protein
MPPLNSNEEVKIPLTQFVREVARESAQKVIDDHVASCGLAKKIAIIEADVYGLPGDDVNVGIKSDVKDLKHSRNIVRWSLRAVWAAIVAGVAALVGRNW